MVKTPDIATLRQWVIRYLPLMRFLDSEPGSGYGTYIITIHGKRPVKIQKVAPAQILEHASDESVPEKL